VTESDRNSSMVGDVNPPLPYSQYFLIGFRRFTKITFVDSGGECSPEWPTGVWGRNHQCCGDFSSFFPKNKAFSSIFWS